MQTATAPSPFAALLRRSKFASYDPYIGQVYTTHGGHAHRGDWGVKRALAKRSRNACITMQSIDSHYQQTEWQDARHQAHWMKKWAEMSKEPDLYDQGTWYRRLSGKDNKWPVDTDFALKSGSSVKETLDDAIDIPVPNVHAMTGNQFENYIDKLRKLRPEFKKFIEQEKRVQEERAKESAYKFDAPISGGENVVLYQEAQSLADWHTQFIKERVKAQSSSPESTSLVQLPHRNAGLSYSHTPHLQDVLLSKPLPGRVLQSSNSRYGNIFQAAVGGFVGELPKNKSDGISPMNFGRSNGQPRANPEAGKGIFRVMKVTLSKAPTTVGPQPERLTDAQLTMSFRSWKSANTVRLNPHRPGSREYVAQDELSYRAKSVPSMMMKAPSRPNRRPQIDPTTAAQSSKAILSHLGSILSRSSNRPKDDEL